MQNTREELLKAQLFNANQQIKTLTAERDQFKHKLQAACTLVAEMHKAAVGGYQGCINGVVEDVADLKKERDALKSALESLCNTGYSQPTSKAWTAAREVLKGLK